MTINDDFEKDFVAALAEVPEMPDCYSGVVRRIHARSAIIRSAWAVAASLLVASGALLYAAHVKNAGVPTEVVDELQIIHSHINGDDVGQELVSCSLVDEESY